MARLGTIILTLAALAGALSGCETAKPKLPPGVHPTVEVGPPSKSEAWQAVATAEDKDRIARLGLAWQEALADAQKTNAGDVHREGKLLLPRSALARPAPTPGSYNCRLINCVLSSNYCAYFGGGTYDSTLTNCKLVGNSANGFGGGAYLGTLNNCLVVSNSASVGGGANSCALYNCVVACNKASNHGDGVTGVGPDGIPLGHTPKVAA
ncbi:MAG: DUF4893 domain-containing protein, partial [Pseudomonadota bacterium]